jgi:hypothetical protein
MAMKWAKAPGKIKILISIFLVSCFYSNNKPRI